MELSAVSRRLISTVLACFTMLFHSQCYGNETPASDNAYLKSRIDYVANSLLLKEIELQRLNEQLHLEAAIIDFKRLRRTWLWDFGNAIPTEGGLIGAAALYYSRSHEKTQKSVQTKIANGRIIYSLQTKKVENYVPGSDSANTIIPQIAGQVVGGTGSLYELGADWKKSRRLRKNKLDKKSITSRVITLQKEIEKLQDNYDKLLSDISDERDLTTYRAEARILKDTTERSLARFISLESAASGMSAGQLIEDVVSATRNTVGTVGNSINVAADFTKDKRFNGNGDIMNLIAASMITTRPLMSNLGEYLAKHANRAQERRNFPLLDRATSFRLASDFEQLQMCRQLTSITPSLSSRLAIYEQERKAFDEEDSLSLYEHERSRQIKLRRFRESLYGPTKMAQSIMNSVVNFRNLDNANADYRLQAVANTTYTSGQVFNISELVRERVLDEKEHAALSKLQMLPEQRIQTNIRRLENMQTSIAHGD